MGFAYAHSLFGQGNGFVKFTLPHHYSSQNRDQFATQPLMRRRERRCVGRLHPTLFKLVDSTANGLDTFNKLARQFVKARQGNDTLIEQGIIGPGDGITPGLPHIIKFLLDFGCRQAWFCADQRGCARSKEGEIVLAMPCFGGCPFRGQGIKLFSAKLPQQFMDLVVRSAFLRVGDVEQ